MNRMPGSCSVHQLTYYIKKKMSFTIKLKRAVLHVDIAAFVHFDVL
jgi:hypothetical protein